MDEKRTLHYGDLVCLFSTVFLNDNAGDKTDEKEGGYLTADGLVSKGCSFRLAQPTTTSIGAYRAP